MAKTPELKLFPLQVLSTGDFIISMGHTFADACETACSSLDIDEHEEFELVEEGDVIEFLNSQYGGATVCGSCM